jgi:hypothetical protein
VVQQGQAPQERQVHKEFKAKLVQQVLLEQAQQVQLVLKELQGLQAQQDLQVLQE